MRRKALWRNLLCLGVVLAVWASGDGHVAFQVGLHNSGQLCRMERSGKVMMSALRRDVILGTSGLLSEMKPICEVPLHRLKPVEGQVGGQFVSISAFIAGEAVELMLDSGLSEGMVTPSLVQKLQLKPIGTAEGATAGGGETVQLVQLEDLRLECGELLAPVTAAVASFPEEKVDKNWVLKGMLGYQALQSYDAELDFPKKASYVSGVPVKVLPRRVRQVWLMWRLWCSPISPSWAFASCSPAGRVPRWRWASSTPAPASRP